MQFNLGAIFIMNLEMFFAKSLTEGPPFHTRAARAAKTATTCTICNPRHIPL